MIPAPADRSARPTKGTRLVLQGATLARFAGRRKRDGRRATSAEGIPAPANGAARRDAGVGLATHTPCPCQRPHRAPAQAPAAPRRPHSGPAERLAWAGCAPLPVAPRGRRGGTGYGALRRCARSSPWKRRGATLAAEALRRASWPSQRGRGVADGQLWAKNRPDLRRCVPRGSAARTRPCVGRHHRTAGRGRLRLNVPV